MQATSPVNIYKTLNLINANTQRNLLVSIAHSSTTFADSTDQHKSELIRQADGEAQECLNKIKEYVRVDQSQLPNILWDGCTLKDAAMEIGRLTSVGTSAATIKSLFDKNQIEVERYSRDLKVEVDSWPHSGSYAQDMAYGFNLEEVKFKRALKGEREAPQYSPKPGCCTIS